MRGSVAVKDQRRTSNRGQLRVQTDQRRASYRPTREKLPEPDFRPSQDGGTKPTGLSGSSYLLGTTAGLAIGSYLAEAYFVFWPGGTSSNRQIVEGIGSYTVTANPPWPGDAVSFPDREVLWGGDHDQYYWWWYRPQQPHPTPGYRFYPLYEVYPPGGFSPRYVPRYHGRENFQERTSNEYKTWNPPYTAPEYPPHPSFFPFGNPNLAPENSPLPANSPHRRERKNPRRNPSRNVTFTWNRVSNQLNITRDHKPHRPRHHERERKGRTTSRAYNTIRRVVDFMGETIEVWDALVSDAGCASGGSFYEYGAGNYGYKRDIAGEMSCMINGGFERVTFEGVWNAYLENTVEDWAYGKIGQGSKGASQETGRFFGYQTGPAL